MPEPIEPADRILACFNRYQKPGDFYNRALLNVLVATEASKGPTALPAVAAIIQKKIAAGDGKEWPKELRTILAHVLGMDLKYFHIIRKTHGRKHNTTRSMPKD